MASKKEKKAQAKAEAEAQAEAAKGPELNLNRIYVECRETKTGKQIMVKLSARIVQVMKDLRARLIAYGDDFGTQTIRVVRYFRMPDGQVIKRVLAEGKPEEAIKQLEDQCLSKEMLGYHMAKSLLELSRASRLRAVSLTYLVEEGENSITGGTTKLFVPTEEFTDAEMSQLISSIHGHVETLTAEVKKEGRKIATQDDVKLVKPGDAGFRMPPKGLHPR